MIVTQLIDIAKRLIKFDKKVNIYLNGVDNQYPERIERLVNNSVTAKMANNLMTQYLLGKGFGEMDNMIVNKSKNLKLVRFADDLASSKAKHKGAFIHVNINFEYKITSLDVLPFNTCRIGVKDDRDYNAKILVHPTWEGKITDKDCEFFDVFNLNPDVVDAQVAKAGGWDNYKGQILFYNDENEFYYPTARIDPVQLDCDNEHLASVAKNRTLRKGFFGKTMVITRPLVDPNMQEFFINEDGDRIVNNLYLKAESEKEKFKKTIQSFLGAENNDGVLHMELDFAGEKLEDFIVFKNVESNINDKMFEFTENSTRKNILVAYNNIPVGLVQSSEGVFQNSGDAILQMKKTYWENTQKERDDFETIINDLLKKFEGFNGQYLTIKPLIANDTNIIN